MKVTSLAEHLQFPKESGHDLLLVKMTADERNFRSSYYEKVGFRSVEEKKSLEILLKDKPLDIVKIRQFCLRFCVPGVHRNLVWKLLLGIVPVHIDSHAFVMSQRRQEYSDLLHGLQLMKIVHAQTPKPQVFLRMWLLETRRLKFDWNSQLDSQLYQNLNCISHSMLNIIDDDVDLYWISKGFFQCIDRFQVDIPKVIEYTKVILEKEDHVLYNHLTEIGAMRMNALPLRDWFCCCYAGVLCESALCKVWDKVLSGSHMVLVFIGVVLLTTIRRTLLKCSSAENACKGVQDITEEMSEVIANKGIEMWQQYGSLLTLAVGPDNIKTNLPTTRAKPVQ